MDEKLDKETVEMLVEMWKRRCDWLWNNAPWFDTPDGRDSPKGPLDVEWIDNQIAKSEE